MKRKDKTQLRKQKKAREMKRGDKLRAMIKGMAATKDGMTIVSWNINGIPVCKHFFRAVTGVRRQLFDGIVAAVEGRVMEQDSLKSIHKIENGMTVGQSKILAFMKEYYTKDRVEYEPASGDLLTIKSSFQKAYEEDYKAHCVAANVKPLSYAAFTEVRRKFFPQLKKHKSHKRKCGFNHTACDICTQSSRAMNKVKSAFEYEKIKSLLSDHISSLVACRMNYQCTEAKAVITNQIFERLDNNCSDVSMVQDASGGTGTVYHPHYHFFSAKEFPKRFDLLRVKCTFCKIHGHGTYIYVSLNQLESSGANLSLEVVYAALFRYLASKPPGHRIRCVAALLLRLLKLIVVITGILLCKWTTSEETSAGRFVAEWLPW
jgi:hypothetical protein